MLVAGGVLLLLLCIVAGVFVVPALLDGEATPTAVSQVEVTLTAPSQAQVTPTAGDLAQVTPTTTSGLQATPTVDGEAPTPLPSGQPGQTQQPPGWTNYGNSNFVTALARQGDTLWMGSTSGLVRWDLTDGSYARLGTEDGLASSYINDLLVSDDGALWIATDAGINRYGGEAMTTYDETDGLDSAEIQTLFQDDVGRILAGSHRGERGLNYFESPGWGPPPVPSLPIQYPYVQALDGSEEIGLYVGLDGDGLAGYEGEEWIVLTSADGLPDDYVYAVMLAGDELWASFNEAMVRIDLETGDTETIPHSYIYSMHQASNGDLWFGGAWRALRYDPITGDWQEFNTAPGPIPVGSVTDIAEGPEGLWFGTHGGGVAFYDGTNWETWTTDDELGGNWIDAIRQGKNGALWFTHEGTGVSRFEPKSDAWQVFGKAEGALDWLGVPDTDSDGNLWIGDDDKLLYYDGQGWQRFTAPELVGVEILGIEIGPNNVKWLVTESGLMRHDPASDEWQVFTGADHTIIDDIRSIHASSDGSLWLGGEEELVRYDGSTWSTPEAWGEPPQYVYDITEAADGSLWVAANGDLWHLADDRWSTYAWPSEGWLQTLAIGPDGSVWAGYEGLGRYDPASGDWQMFTIEDGLVHWRVQAIHVTPEGVVWIGTDGGLSRYVPPD
jgi:ligand-binding sensor domain-containing protein